ncbi:segregation/condensation protein A [Oscillatoria sp. FACHB-1407]|uniref:segregation/condensation protein A n=1 Tax=Oscillatoria sp. FACHB-1407 TaxID=2692847 RepID=UPI001688F1B7|nr:segregation/condensation protein A [Oscillatoria sp. FACHB-1407]MBD2461672.1 segregation/condensation protein A [Oscillatoria sp. FACHB-1407]
MALSLAQNAIALLIDLAERGEIDPWDVKVIEVIDRFLSQLNPLHNVEAGRAPYEADLSESGQAFLYASVLVLLKADSLARSDREPEEELEPEELLTPEGTAPLPLRLEQTIRRRATARPPQNRRVTLKELIAQLEIMAATVADHKPRIRARRPRPQSRTQAVRAIAQLAHQENLSEIAAALEQFLHDHWQEVSEGEEWLDFDVLLELWINSDAQRAIATDPSAHHSEQSDRVGVFWALLFLSAQTKVELSQEEFYQDLRVRSLSHLSSAELASLSTAILND